MGKVRVKTIGIEEDEKDQKKKAKERAEAKRIEAAKKQGADKKAQEETTSNATDARGTNETEATKIPDVKPEEKPTKSAKKPKSSYAKKNQKQPRSSNYLAIAKLVEKDKKYKLDEALKILSKAKRGKFDETVELHINTNERGVSGNITLPHGTGKKTRVEIADHAGDPKHVEELVKKVTAGQVDFDILIATPDTMSHLAKVARVLGPRGLMPNPKNGTIHPKPKEAAKKFEGGQINFKTEAKAPIIHMTVGKMSFEEKQLTENVKAVLQAVKTQNIKNVTLKSTMSPGIKLVI